jgi:hypothetical protein
VDYTNLVKTYYKFDRVLSIYSMKDFIGVDSITMIFVDREGKIRGGVLNFNDCKYGDDVDLHELALPVISV